MRRRSHGLELHEQVGKAVLDRLKAPDRPAELHPLLEVLHRGFEQDVRRADGLGRLQDGGECDAVLHHVASAGQLVGGLNRHTLEPDLGEAPRHIEPRQRPRRQTGTRRVARNELTAPLGSVASTRSSEAFSAACT